MIKHAAIGPLLWVILGCGQLSFEAAAVPGEVLHIGGAVHAPQMIIDVGDPELTDEAKSAHKSVEAQVYLWVGNDGVPSHLRIVRSANMGAAMDRRLLDAVSKSRYKPSTLNGKPVTVDLYVTINMDVF